MKIYAIRDRLIDYFMQPFFGPSDKQVLAAIAQTVNDQEGKSAINQTPQHFEVWRLGEIDEQTGQVEGDREYLADAASLIRDRVRADAEIRPGHGTLDGTEGQSPRPAPPAGETANTGQRASQSATQAKDRQGTQVTSGPGRPDA